MWDVYDELIGTEEIGEFVVPLRPTLGQLWSLCLRLRQTSRDYDLVHAQFGSLVGLVSAFSSRPVVLTLRGTDLYVMPAHGLARWTMSPLRQLITYFACLRAETILVMSQRMADKLGRWPFLGRKRILLVTDPAGQEFFRRNGGRGRRASLKVFTGAMDDRSPIKRTWLIRDAADLCLAIDIPVDLRIISGRPRREVGKLLSQCDLLALASTHEGWPNVVKEGLLCGVPFIATDVSDLASLAQGLSPNRIVPPDSIAFAHAFIDTWHSLALGSQTARFLPACVADKHRAVYEYILRREKS